MADFAKTWCEWEYVFCYTEYASGCKSESDVLTEQVSQTCCQKRLKQGEITSTLVFSLLINELSLDSEIWETWCPATPRNH